MAFAHDPQDGDIHAMAGLLTYQTHTLNHQFKSPVLFTPGLVAEADIDNHGGVEISFFYLDNPFSVERRGQIVTEREKRMYIASGYRHWFNTRFSGALAFFSSYSMGKARVVRDDFGTILDKPGTSAHDLTEYGFEGSVQFEPIAMGRFSLVLDGRYAYSVTGKRHEDGNHYGLLVALKYFVQSREKAIER